MKDIFDTHIQTFGPEGEICGQIFMSFGHEHPDGIGAVRLYLKEIKDNATPYEAIDTLKRVYPCRNEPFKFLMKLIDQSLELPSS